MLAYRPAVVVMSAVLSVCPAGSLLAQEWPTRPVTMVIPFAAGGPLDAIGRILAPRLGEILGQQVVVENITGAGGMIGSNRVAKSADSHVFLLGHTGTIAYNQTLYKRPAYNSLTEFAPVSLTTEGSYVLITRKDLAPNNLAEFAAFAKDNQARLQYGSGGAGSNSHIACVMLNMAIGTSITHVPYRGSGPAMQDLLGGRIDFNCEPVTTALAQIQAKTVKAIAILSPTRSPVLPDLATAHEQGLANFDVDTWNALLLPRSTSAAAVLRLAKAASETIDTPAVRGRLEALGQRIVPPERRGPDHLAKFIPREIERWAGPIKASGVAVD
jgi:tripartite-type tricarboxylate transporter receptor subunit TctC